MRLLKRTIYSQANNPIKNTIFIKSRSFTDTFGTFIKKKSLHHLIRNYCKILRRKTALPLLDPNIQEYCFEGKKNFMAAKDPPDILYKLLLMKNNCSNSINVHG
jgi:hypothetical protein